MIGKVIDIRKWTANQRSVMYRLTEDQTEFALIIGPEIGRDGSAEIAIFGRARMMPWQVLSRYGTKIGQFQFIEPQPEIQKLLDILTGKDKPGAPLPDEKEKVKDDSGSGELIDPLDDKPARHTRTSAVRNSRL